LQYFSLAAFMQYFKVIIALSSNLPIVIHVTDVTSTLGL
jgi:hypothetical protein